MRTRLAVCLFLCATGVLAGSDPAERARAASDLLIAARERLEEAEGARDRVRALTETVSAYEAGLSALRSGLRLAAQRQSDLSEDLLAREEEVSVLLAALMRVGGTTSPVFLLHPAGPTGTARAGMLLAELTPALDAQADALRDDYLELQSLNALLTDAAVQLEQGLADVQVARTTLNQAIADRTELPKSFVADPVREAILLSSSETLESFAAGLDQISSGISPEAPELPAGDGNGLDLPVVGQIIRRSGEADAAGIVRPGIIVATMPRALVTSPVNATLRYAGPLLDFGNVVILEPQADVLFVFAGLERVYPATGDVIDAGAPLGLMGDAARKSGAQVSTDGDRTGDARTETLYIEVRQNNTPENPNLWFRSEEDG